MSERRQALRKAETDPTKETDAIEEDVHLLGSHIDEDDEVGRKLLACIRLHLARLKGE